ncbi:unnamed protein product [Camellia sinensis]
MWSTSRADFPFYGVDFTHSRPTGTFSNGLNSADFLAKLTGFKRSPQPYLFLLSLPSGLKRRKHRGVNFTSGGAGLLDTTNKARCVQINQHKVVSLTKQIQQFFTVYNNHVVVMGSDATKKMLSKSLFFISVGSNDIFGYFLTNSTMPPELYITHLMHQYEAYIKKSCWNCRLYNFGAKKFGIIGVPPIGCCPAQRRYNATRGCQERLNDFARAFHFALDTLMRKISTELPEMKYSLGNTYELIINIIQIPVLSAGRLNAEIPCNATAILCKNRKEYLFWDLYHPTQATSQLAAVTLYDGPPRFVTAINFRQLAKDN